MTDDLSPEQQTIIDRPLVPIAVIACAGSGKTKTAVHRLAAMRRKHAGPGLIALVSFSNVAVDAFQAEYSALTRDTTAFGRGSDVEIDTMDGFITTNVLRPHGHRLMKSPRTPFLVEGRERFLQSFKVYDGSTSRPAADIKIAWEGLNFRYGVGKEDKVLAPKEAEKALNRLAATGAYTHETARYWVLRILREEGFVLRALARRYPHIVVDEAQDVGPEHQAILELLIKAGSQVSLIGDPNQGIYEFARATGGFLRGYGGRTGVSGFRLTVNYRSVPGIVDIANKLTARTDRAGRAAAGDRPAAYYMPFKEDQRERTLASFRSILEATRIEPAKGVVLCRSASLAAEWSGEKAGQGVGVIKCFADAAISRDRRKDHHQAFTDACLALSGLLAPKHGSLLSQLVRPADDTMRRLRRVIWTFVRDPSTGLPAASLVADASWHPLLCIRSRALLGVMERDFGFVLAENLGQRLAKTKLESRPLVEEPDLAGAEGTAFRTSTVHKVKGESLDAVLYVTKKKDVRALLDGTETEEGRIGYVALTRARNLFVLAVPEASLPEFEAKLEAVGLSKPF